MEWAEFGSSVRHLSDGDREVVRRAFDIGERAHKDQRRQSGEPYFSHPIAVARMLADMGGDRDTIIAGLLHDTVEDTPVTLRDIEREFGPAVATLIDGVTKLEHVDMADKPHLDEQIETLRKMFTLMQQDIRIMVIKLADRLHNMQTIAFVPPEKQIRIARETMDVYVKVADRLGMRDLKDDLEGLSQAILEPELHARLMELRLSKEHIGQKVLLHVLRQLHETHPDLTKDVEMHYEHKSWARLRELLKAEGAKITGLASVAVAVVCDTVDECYSLMGALHQQWPREILSFQDFINLPMINGYRALHTTIIMEDGTRVRCKIRTKDMELYAHRGITVSCFDSTARGLLDLLPWTKRIATISSDTRNASAEFWEGLQSDILGATILVHGPDDNTVMLPREATVLDAAFYLFGEHALHTVEIRMNGRPVSFDEPLMNASSIYAVFASEPQANLRWLHFVNTAVASAIIRTQLATAPETEKIAVGRELLDIALQRSANIKLAELSLSMITNRMPEFGLTDFDDLLERIAEGKLDPSDVAAKIFVQRARRLPFTSDMWILRAEVPYSLEEQIFKIARGYPNVSIGLEHNGSSSRFTIRFRLSHAQIRELEGVMQVLLPADAWTLQSIGMKRALVIIGATIVTLWGLDPVFARYILHAGVNPYDLTVLRAVVFFLASAGMYGAQLLFFGRRLKWLSPRNPTLIFTGAALFLTAFFSYVALQGISASVYILLVTAALLGTVMSHQILHREQWKRTGASFLIICVAALLAGYVLGYQTMSLLSGMGCALGFSLYTELSRRYQQTEAPIRARYPAFLFWISSVGLILAGFVAPFSGLQHLSFIEWTMSILYVLIFSVLPYSLYFEITRRIDSSLVDRSSPLVVIIAVVGELVVFQFAKPLFLLPILVFFVWYYYGSLRKQGRSANVLWRPSYASPR